MNLDSFDPLALVMLLAGMSLLPLLLICTTCFFKVSMVLLIVRNAIGVQQVPPTIAIYAIALSITLFVMAPVARDIERALPKNEMRISKIALNDLIQAAEPLRLFMVSHTPPEKRSRYLEVATSQWPADMAATVKDTDFVIVIPSFVVSELELAFEIGLIIYIPFVVIDLLISNILLALGMQMVSPMVVSLPLKMLLFVLLDGWSKLIESLLTSY